MAGRLLSVPNPLPAAFLRGGTSKGVFINRAHLPSTQSDWAPIFRGLMGSPDEQYGRQLNGMGGGVSSLSKIVVVSPTQKEGMDAEYTFVQVGIKDSKVEYIGNCGNLSTMAGIFAVDEGLCKPRRVHDSQRLLGQVDMWNTNTSKQVRTTFPLSSDGGPPSARLDLDEAEISGVSGRASRIILDFIDPAGTKTGRLLPTSNPSDSIPHADAQNSSFSLVDATNPSVLVPSSSIFNTSTLPGQTIYASEPRFNAEVERIRASGAELMRLASPLVQSQPKIAVLGDPQDGDDVDIDVHAFSMGVLHRAVPMTLGLCIGVAAHVRGTCAWDIVKRSRNTRVEKSREEGIIRLRTPSGVIDVGAEMDAQGGVRSARVVRTGRRLMKGHVWW